MSAAVAEKVEWSRCLYCGCMIPGIVWVKSVYHHEDCPRYEKPKRKLRLVLGGKT